MSIVVIIQARMGSTRLPGKVMEDISGKPMIWHVIDRIKKSEKIDFIVLATTNKDEDKIIVKLAQKTGVKIFMGDEKDVLNRYYSAAKKYSADIVVRVSGDCPLIDPQIIDKMVSYYLENKNRFDYIGMGENNPCPHGLDNEVFSFESLEKAWIEAELPSEREHVTPYIWKNKEKFSIGSCLTSKKDYSNLRWVVDEKSDLKFVREIYRYLYQEGSFFTTKDILKLLESKHELLKINEGIIKQEGYYKSLEEDKEFLNHKNNI